MSTSPNLDEKILKAILGLAQPPQPPKEVVVAEYWYEFHPFKIFVNGEYWFWADTKEIAEEIASAIRESRMPAEWAFTIR